MFIIKCLNCDEGEQLLHDKMPTRPRIVLIQGAAEQMFDVEVFITCSSCGNSVTISDEGVTK